MMDFLHLKLYILARSVHYGFVLVVADIQLINCISVI